MEKNNIAHTFWLNTYLSDYDLVYKYSIDTKYQIPIVENINLSLALQNNYGNDLKKIGNASLDMTCISFLFLFSIFFILPYVKSKIFSSSDGSTENSTSKIYLKYSFSAKKQKNLFFFLFFVECWTMYLKQGFKLNITFPFLTKKTKAISYLKAHLPLSILPNYDFFYNFSNASSIINEDLSIFILFKFNHLLSDSSINCIKNLPLFWKSEN